MPDAPLDLDAIRARAEAAGKILALIQGGPGGLVGPSAADVPVLLAEVERLRAESVPRSALVRVGWIPAQMVEQFPIGLTRHPNSIFDTDLPVCIIREDTDA